MYIKLEGDWTLATNQQNDAITKVEIATRLYGRDGTTVESAADAVTAGRVIELTNSAEIAAFLDTGVVKSIPVLTTRRTGWHTFKLVVTGTTGNYSAVTYFDGIQIHSSYTVPITIGQIVLRIVRRTGDSLARTVYFSNVLIPGQSNEVLNYADNSTMVAAGWTNTNSGVTTTYNQTISGIAGIKLVTDSTDVAHNTIWYKSCPATGTYSVDVYDSGDNLCLMQIQLRDTGNTNSIYIDIDSNNTTFTNPDGLRSGFIYAGYVNKILPSVRLTESRGGLGSYAGAWTDASTFVSTPIALSTYSSGSSVTSKTLSWPVHTGAVGYKIYYTTNSTTPTYQSSSILLGDVTSLYHPEMTSSYRYRIVGINQYGQESGASQTVSGA